MKRFFKNFISRLTPSCREMARLCSESLDRDLTFGERLRMRIHGWICSWCIDYSDQIHQVNSIVREEAESLAEMSSEAMPAECRERIRQLIEESAQNQKTSG